MQIYLIVNRATGRAYVGKTVSDNLYKYLSVKRWQVRHGHVRGMPIIASIRKHGWGAFDVIPIAFCDTEERLNLLEKLWILVLDTTNPKYGYNVSHGGESAMAGRHVSEDHKRKIGLANRGRKPRGYLRTEEHRKQIKERMVGNTRAKGKPHTGWMKLTPEARKDRSKKMLAARWGR